MSNKDDQYNIGYLVEDYASFTINSATGEVEATINPLAYTWNDYILADPTSGTASINYLIFDSNNISSNLTNDSLITNETFLGQDGFDLIDDTLTYYQSIFGNIFHSTNYDNSKIKGVGVNIF